MTKKGNLPWYEYVYDDYYDCILCPQNQVLNSPTVMATESTRAKATFAKIVLFESAVRKAGNVPKPLRATSGTIT